MDAFMDLLGSAVDVSLVLSVILMSNKIRKLEGKSTKE